MLNADLALKFAAKVFRNPAVRWSYAMAFALVGCGLTACSSTYRQPDPVAVPEPPSPPASCEQACAVLADAGCLEGRPAWTIQRADGGVRNGVGCLKVCTLAREDGLPLASRVPCIVASRSYGELRECGVCQ